jgi:hypothetical protein
MLDDGSHGSKNEIAVQTILRVTERRDDAYGVADSETCYAAADGINLTGSLQTELCGKGRRRTVGGCTEVDLRAIQPDRLRPNSDFPGSRFRCGDIHDLEDLRGPRLIK